MITADLTSMTRFKEPFPHCRVPSILSAQDAARTLRWLEEDAPWRQRIEEFYEQDECSLLAAELTEDVRPLIDPTFTTALVDALRKVFGIDGDLTITEVAAHRLRPGQTIRVHNDYIGGEETHRLLIQLNTGWHLEQGGLLMLFGSAAAEDVRSVMVPAHRSGLAFEISPRSFHAVSQVKNGERFTLVYSFGRRRD
jgi:hypothetical protein